MRETPDFSNSIDPLANLSGQNRRGAVRDIFADTMEDMADENREIYRAFHSDPLSRR